MNFITRLGEYLNFPPLLRSIPNSFYGLAVLKSLTLTTTLQPERRQFPPAPQHLDRNFNIRRISKRSLDNLQVLVILALKNAVTAIVCLGRLQRKHGLVRAQAHFEVHCLMF